MYDVIAFYCLWFFMRFLQDVSKRVFESIYVCTYTKKYLMLNQWLTIYELMSLKHIRNVALQNFNKR